MALPMRSCVVCRKKLEKESLNRYVWCGQKPVLDEEQIMPGRGAYCCQREKCTTHFLQQKKMWQKVYRRKLNV